MRIIETQIYRILVPKFIRKQIVAHVLRIKVLDYYDHHSELVSKEIERVLDYLKNRSVAMIPYYFQDQYIEENVEVHDDPDKGLKYVLLDRSEERRVGKECRSRWSPY